MPSRAETPARRSGYRREFESGGRASLIASLLATRYCTVYNIVVPEPASSNPKSRRWTVIASGLLCLGLAVVVIYTRPSAFLSPLAIVVVAAIGLAAVLLQLRFYNRQQSQPLRAPTWLNLLGIVCALAAVFGDFLRLSAPVAQLMALGAVGVFSVSSAMILHGFRKRRSQSSG